jgi:hypothetical protein
LGVLGSIVGVVGIEFVKVRGKVGSVVHSGVAAALLNTWDPGDMGIESGHTIGNPEAGAAAVPPYVG